jgi:hypothetical protein
VQSENIPTAVSCVRFLKRALLGFWAAWLTVVFLTNLLDGAKALGWLPPSWKFASGNYCFLVEVTARYEPPGWLNVLLFSGVLCWEALAALLFWAACWTFSAGGAAGRRTLYAAFTVGLLLWAGLLLADELCIAYQVERAHWPLFIAQLATLLAVELLPER